MQATSHALAITRRCAMQLAASAFASGVIGAAELQPRQRSALHVALVQTPARAVDPSHAQRDLDRNLDEVERLCERAQGAAKRCDLIVLHAAALTGWHCWAADALARVAIDVRGAEIARLERIARRTGCHLALGAIIRRSTAAAGSAPDLDFGDRDWGEAGLLVAPHGTQASRVTALEPTIAARARGDLERSGGAPTAVDAHLLRFGPAHSQRAAVRLDIGSRFRAVVAPCADSRPPGAPAARAGARSRIEAQDGSVLAAARSCADEIVIAALPL